MLFSITASEVWTYVLGPFLSLLPRAWREPFGARYHINWAPATVVSGVVESLAALFALIVWYSYSVTHWVELVISATIQAHPEAAIPENAVGFAGLALLFLHPLTWAISWFAIEGAVRALGAAFTGNILGSFPIVLLQCFVSVCTNVLPARASRSSPLPDQVFLSNESTGQIVEICSCAPKPGWDPPRIIRCGGVYYRLEACSMESSSRPFRFLLKRLPAGVPSSLVLEYSPESGTVVTRRTGS